MGWGRFRTVIIVKVDLPVLGLLEGRTSAWRGYFLKGCCIVKCWHAGLLDVPFVMCPFDDKPFV